MAAPTSALSQTLKSISLTKIREISKQRAIYEQRKDAVLAEAAAADDPHARIARLLRGVEDLYPSDLSDNKVENVKHWVQQSRYDASVPADTLASCEALLREKLEVQSRRLGLAHLYSRLVTEWMEPSAPMSGEVVADEGEDSFEVVDRQKERLRELCERFEQVVFSPLDTDETEIDLYLSDLFPSDDAKKALAKLRRDIGFSSDDLTAIKEPFRKETLKWSIDALLSEDLLSDEKQAILREFLDNDVVLLEIADVLNMRYADFSSWEWDAGESGIPVLPRQQLNGKYRIWMDEDVLQAIFVEYVGIRCCNLLSAHLKEFARRDWLDTARWRPTAKMQRVDEIRRKYYLLGNDYYADTVCNDRVSDYGHTFFISQLPADPTALGAGGYSNDGARDDDKQGKGWSNIKQQLLRTLATELMVHRDLRGEAAVVQTDLKWYATGLSHTTIFAIMRFFGFSEGLIAFYKKVLEAPLNMAPADGGEGEVRIRRRGVPMAHATEKFIGELVLFVMDFVVIRETGMLLYRLHDDIFLVGEPERCVRAWEAMSTCAKVMGLEFNRYKTGSVYLTDGEKVKNPEVARTLPEGEVKIGHLALDESGEWVIDQEQVGEHVAQLEKQLGASRSILGWVQTWNSCIGRFFSHTFGEPGYCFGLAHVDSILETYKDMNCTLFGEGGSAVGYLKGKIAERFGVEDVPDAFIFLPEKLGGLALRNPFIGVLAVRDELSKPDSSPTAILQKARDKEEERYEKAKKRFYEFSTPAERMRRLRRDFGDSDSNENVRKEIYELIPDSDLDTFFTFEEYSRFRESTSSPLSDAYRRLVEKPRTDGPVLDRDVNRAVVEVGTVAVSSLAGLEVRWEAQMRAEGMRRELGGVRVVEGKLLPLGVLHMMRQKAVRWNMVL